MRLTRLVVAGVLAGAALLAPAAQAEAPDCWKEPCYQCVMYPCGPGDWVEFLTDKPCNTVRNLC